MQYAPLIDLGSPRGSITSIDPNDKILLNEGNPNEHRCRTCKSKLSKKQQTNHTPIECLSQRCEMLENDVTRLKDHDTKSRLKIKELENKINAFEDAIKALTSPKQQQATPFSFGLGQKGRRLLTKSHSVDEPAHKGEINYDNIIQLSKANTRDRVGLFGSLGASSQQR